MASKLEFDGKRLAVSEARAVEVMTAILGSLGCGGTAATMIADHLADASLCGVESHGVMRILQYARQFRSGYMTATGRPQVSRPDGQFLCIDGGGGHGIPAMQLAFDASIEQAAKTGICVTSITNLGHTGRHGAFAELAADAGMLSILIGGGNRAVWRQVAPHGGAKAKLPTNPWCLGLPGGAHGPFILDLATSTVAGGWIYAAESAGARLPAGCLIDRDGRPSTDPASYFDGGAILPAAGQKGYAMALAAELIAEALIGPVATEANWLLIMIDSTRMTSGHGLQSRAEEVLADIRSCPPAPGFDRVEIPGERERRCREVAGGVINIPEKTWQDILDLRDELAGAA
ncbi:MAG: Ldh family oxidoreductase [Candidatus Puniceispirillaceae bacterium]